VSVLPISAQRRGLLPLSEPHLLLSRQSLARGTFSRWRCSVSALCQVVDVWMVQVVRGPCACACACAGKPDSYVSLRYGGQSFHTKVVDNTNDPEFHEEFVS
jgi:hypothetical protein